MKSEPRPHPFQICQACATPEELRFKIHNEHDHESICGICGKGNKVTRSQPLTHTPTKRQTNFDNWKAGVVVLFLVGTLGTIVFGVLGLAIYGVWKLLGH